MCGGRWPPGRSERRPYRGRASLGPMKVRVEFQTYLDQYSPTGDNVFAYEMPEGSTIGDMLRRLQVPPELSAVIAVGDEAATIEHTMSEGERITIVPPVSGG